MQLRTDKKINIREMFLFGTIGIYLASVLLFQYENVHPISDNVLIRFFERLHQTLNGYGFSGALSSILLGGYVYVSINHIKGCSRRFNPLLICVSILFGIMNVMGLMMFHMDNLPFFESNIWLLITCFLVFGWALLFYLTAHWILHFLGYIHSQTTDNIRTNRLATLFDRHTWLFSFAVILICWLPWLIVYYPASMDWDVYRQLCSALSLGYYARSNHDPWLASCVLAWFYNIGANIGDKNLGIFLFVFVRNLVIASIYANCVRHLVKAGIRRGICVATLLFYAITPVWGAYAKHAFKDTLAGALMCSYIVSLISVIMHAKAGDLTWKHCLACCLATIATVLFRNNPIYAILPATVLLIIYLICQRVHWTKCLALILAVSVYFVFNYCIFNFANVKEGSDREAKSILFQQTARTVKYYGDQITNEEKEVIDAYLDYGSMAERYNPILSDPIKDLCKDDQNGEDAAGNYLKTWFSMLKKYPDTYIEAAVGASYGYYAFTPKLPEGAGNWNSGMGIFHWIKVKSFNKYTEFGFDYIERFAPARTVLHTWTKVWDSLPILSLTDTIAAYTWAIILIACLLLNQKKWPELIVIVVLGIMILTCIASPVNDAFRYYCPVAASAPALLLLIPKKKALTSSNQNT